MVVFLYFIEINGFGNFLIDYLDSTEYKFTEYIFTVHKIKNEDLQNTIEAIFNDVIKNVKIQQLYLFEFWFGDDFLFLGIQFHSDNISPLEMIDKINKASDDLLKKLQASEKIKLNIYYIVDIYLHHNITYYIEDLLKNEIEKKYEILASYPLFNLSYSPFTLKISSRYNIEYLNCIKTGIKECFEKSFPHSLDHIPILIMHKSGRLIYKKSFRTENIHANESLIAGVMTSLEMMLERVTHEKSMLTIEKEGKIIITQPGKFIYGLLICDENLKSLHILLNNFIEQIELIYSKVLETWDGDLKVFIPINDIANDIFL